MAHGWIVTSQTPTQTVVPPGRVVSAIEVHAQLPNGTPFSHTFLLSDYDEATVSATLDALAARIVAVGNLTG